MSNSAADQAEPGKIVERLVAFARFVRANGFRIGISDEVDAAQVAVVCGIHDRERLREGLRSLFCKTRGDWERFAEIFDTFWSSRPPHTSIGAIEANGRKAGGADKRGPSADTSTHEAPAAFSPGQGLINSGASARESIERQDFRHFFEHDDMRMLAALIQRLARRMRKRVMHRLELSPSGKRLNFRSTIRKSLRYGGTPFNPVFRIRRKRQPRLVLLLDISGSMKLYSMLFLRFARAIAQVFDNVEVFLFHTSLVRSTDALREPSAARMQQRMEIISAGWAGGTRIGASIVELNKRFGNRVCCRRPVVIIMSDGLDTGPPEQLAQALRELRLRARRVVWLNPLLGREGYAPTARGMSAALPYLDAFLPAHNLASLEALEPYLVSL